ncbi:tetraacyldisaccharide 4'-kinase [Hymenobacter sp. BRD67]|uniref:tetraacyldisaccharide 4'-kinase n=1 Tax=Hymenobacter sp. BRD67 TaxID=2675877 RepID=UPI0015647316|nr:tetraacyldisaccharide 4'-kinase [Hymenobacter sp. BRD67]QKG52344.1 tetraacyldisaccharide 4'-kinase [Hymenobacter sp. BRD67]
MPLATELVEVGAEWVGAEPGPPPGPGPALLLTGIAQPGPLRSYLESQGYTIMHHEALPDHHAFQPADLAALQKYWQPGWPVFTTEKDATRLSERTAPGLWAGRPGGRCASTRFRCA